MKISEEDIPFLYQKRDRKDSKNLFTKRARIVSLENVYMVKRRKCNYPYCRTRKMDFLTVDHIVPISVAYYLNWTAEETRSIENLQPLCREHHAIKDENVGQLRTAAWRYDRHIQEDQQSKWKKHVKSYLRFRSN